MSPRRLPMIRRLTPVLLVAFLVTGIGLHPTRAESSRTTTSSLVERAKELMSAVEQLRGLSFLHDLPVELVSQDQITAIIQDELDDQMTEEMDHTFSAMYALLGLIPPRSSLRESYEQMVEEQVAGLYDPSAKRFYVVDIDMSEVMGSMFSDLGGPLGSLIEGFFEGFGVSLTDTMTDSIIVHELTHALDDQHFDIEATIDELMAADSDDAQLAYQSLLEGNATRIMNDYTYSVAGLDPSMAEAMTELNLTLVETIMDYSPFLERIMVAPYLQGEIFVRHVVDREGQSGLDEAFIHPPESMEQILHPERYTPHPDRPSVVSDPDLSNTLPGWELEGADTLGELIIGVMFEIQAGGRTYAEDIAEGWDGDRLTTWRSDGEDLAFAWVSVWDSERDAEDFFDAYLNLLELKHPAGTWADRDSHSALYTGLGLAAALQVRADTVVIVEGVPESLADECVEAAWETPVMHR